MRGKNPIQPVHHLDMVLPAAMADATRTAQLRASRRRQLSAFILAVIAFELVLTYMAILAGVFS